VWRYYNGLARGLELTPVLLEQSRQLLETASDAIQGPKCTGDTRKQAIAALRNAKKQHDRARDRIVMGRTGSVITPRGDPTRHHQPQPDRRRPRPSLRSAANKPSP
jgi:hypothetical protein